MNAPEQILRPVSARRTEPFSRVPVRHWVAEGGAERRYREVPEEVPVALRVNCEDFAVMLASPADLEDFVYGFLYTERRIRSVADVVEVALLEREEGLVARITLGGDAPPRQASGTRRLAGATGCGLCGVQALRDAVRPVSQVQSTLRCSPAAVRQAVASLHDWQPLAARAGALHVAAFADSRGRIVTAREDVGRHNALDKLIGAMLRDECSAQDGFVVLSSRCSYELVQKAAVFGVGMLCTVSAPTALAVRLAAEADMTLVSLARSDAFSVLTGEERFDWHEDA